MENIESNKDRKVVPPEILQKKREEKAVLWKEKLADILEKPRKVVSLDEYRNKKTKRFQDAPKIAGKENGGGNEVANEAREAEYMKLTDEYLKKHGLLLPKE